ncbi:MAG: SDR family oxidoreductase [Lentisphaeria bacterium]|nr:SDR family oxidoreductase [Lentisphaeria bacterium]
MSKIFLTGITGLVGRAFTVSLLRERNDIELICLVRSMHGKGGLQRVQEIISSQCVFDSCQEDTAKILSKVKVIEGDVVDLNPKELAKNPLLKGVDVVFHCAADVNLGKDLTGKTFKINYEGTVNVLGLAKLLQVKEFHYVSTAYIAGKLTGRAMEDTPIDSGFNNSYEESKFKAEQLVRNSGIPFSIYRPAIIIGRLTDGRILKPLAFYRILEFIAKLKKNVCAKNAIPVSTEIDLKVFFQLIPSDLIYFVPIDYIQKAITALFQKPVCNRTYHVTGDAPVTTKEIRDAICEVLHLKTIDIGATTSNAEATSSLMERFLGDLFPYFSSQIVFDQTNVRAGLPEGALDWTVGKNGLKVMISSFYKDFFPEFDWIK